MRLVGAFDHDARQRLGAAVAQHQAAVVAEAVARPAPPAAATAGRSSRGRACARTRTFWQHLREAAEVGEELARAARPARATSSASTGARSAGRRRWSRARRSTRWPDCSPPSRSPSRAQRLDHLAVADVAAHDVDAVAREGALEAEVAHRGGDDRRAASSSPRARAGRAPRGRAWRRRRAPSPRSSTRRRGRRRRRRRRRGRSRPSRTRARERLGVGRAAVAVDVARRRARS